MTQTARRASLLLLLALGFLSASTASAQKPKYKVGDHIEFSSNSACLGEQFALPTQGTIVEVALIRGSYTVEVDPIPNRTTGITTKTFYTEDCFRLTPPPGAAPAPAANAPAAPAPTPVRPNVAPQAGGVAKFKVGDHVEFSQNGACLGAQFAIPTKGTIVEVNLGNVMNYVMQVDPEPNKSPKIISRPIESQVCGFRLLAGPAPSAPVYNCPLDPPAGPNSKSSGPSEQVFKRAIYDEIVEAESQHRDIQRIGMSFEIFQVGTPYANQMTQGGLRKDGSISYLRHDGAPPNATIFPVKVKFSECLQRPTWKKLWVIEENRDCFLNRVGNWACPIGTGGTKFLVQMEIPN